MKILRIDWRDARTFSHMAHTKEEVIEMATLIPATTVGFLVHEDKEKVVLSSLLFWGGDATALFEVFRVFHVIPKDSIVKRRVLK